MYVLDRWCLVTLGACFQHVVISLLSKTPWGGKRKGAGREGGRGCLCVGVWERGKRATRRGGEDEKQRERKKDWEGFREEEERNETLQVGERETGKSE